MYKTFLSRLFRFLYLKKTNLKYEFCFFFFLFRCFKHLPNKSVTIHAPTGSTKKKHTHTRQVKSSFLLSPSLWFLSSILFLNAVINKRNDIMCVFPSRNSSYLRPASSASIKETCSFEKLTSRWWRGFNKGMRFLIMFFILFLPKTRRSSLSMCLISKRKEKKNKKTNKGITY